MMSGPGGDQKTSGEVTEIRLSSDHRSVIQGAGRQYGSAFEVLNGSYFLPRSL